VVGTWDRALLKVQPFSPNDKYFEPGESLCAATLQGRRLLRVRESEVRGKAYILDCGLTTTDEANALLKTELFVHPQMRPELPPDEFYLDELIGLKVMTENGDDWGEIVEVIESPAHNVYVTKCAMIPGHPDFIVKTDWENRVLTVREVPGLRTDEKTPR
jgi:16S rRNA processing protein RimM